MAEGYIVTVEVFVTDDEADNFAWGFGGGKKNGAKEYVNEVMGEAQHEDYEIKSVRKVKQ